jgi:hypothetical protein
LVLSFFRPRLDNWLVPSCLTKTSILSSKFANHRRFAHHYSFICAHEAVLREPFRFISDKLGDGDAAIAKLKEWHEEAWKNRSG